MKRGLLIFLLLSISLFAEYNSPILQESINYIEENEGAELVDIERYKPFKRLLHIWQERIHNDELPDVMEIYNIIQEEKSKKKSNQLLTANKTWKSIGPIKPPSNRGIGRINRLRFHPNDENIIFAATAGGGVWKTENSGSSWEILPTSDFISMNYSDVVISESNPNVIYLATGDANVAYLNRDFYSIGILKSTNGGNSFFPTNLTYELADGEVVGSILVDPEDENYVIAGTSEGIFISTDGGDTWENKRSGQIKDLNFLPNDKNVVLGTTFLRDGGASVIRSEDKGETWENVVGFNNSVRMEIATDKNHPDFVAAIAVEVRPYNFLSFLTSTDGGKTFQEQSNKSTVPNITGRNNGRYPTGEGSDVDQSWYNLTLAISPLDRDLIFVGGIVNWATGNGGSSWFEPDINPHVDQHYQLFSRDGETLYLANDGGFYDFNINTLEYSLKSDDMMITQFYKCDNSSDLKHVIGGTQDNSTFAKNVETDFWFANLSGDGMDCHIDPENSQRWYGSSQYGSFRRTDNGGSNWKTVINRFRILNDFGEEEEGDWVTPMAVDPNNPEIIYVGYQNIWKNTNYGEREDWERVSDLNSENSFEFLEVSEKNSNYVVGGFSTAIFISKDAGENWEQLPAPNGTLSNITFHPENEEILYATSSNYRGGQKVFKFENGDWENMSGNLPNVPANVIKVQKNSPERMYVGTDIGVYYSDYGSKYWERYGSNMPYTIVNDIEVDEQNDFLLAATYGRGMWENSLIYCDEDRLEITNEGDLDFCDGESVTLRVINPMQGVSYEWSNGEFGEEIEVTEPGVFSVKTAGPGECNMKSNPLETSTRFVNEFNITAANDTICPGDSVRLVASIGFSDYQWNEGGSTFQKFATKAGVYSVEASQNNGCTVFAEIEIFEAEPDAPVIQFTSNTLTTINNYDGYQWYLNEEPIDGATQSSFSATFTGDYKVRVKSPYGCEVYSESVFIDPTSVEYDNTNFEIIPNPNDGHFTIKSGELASQNFDITITNINGEEIYKLNNVLLKESGNKFDLDNISVGVYFIKLQNEKKTYVEKIIVE